MTLDTPTSGATLDLDLYSDATYQTRFAIDTGNRLQGALHYVKAQTSNLYMLISDTFSTGGSYDFVLNVQDYDSYAGLIDITGAYPYSGITMNSSESPYQVTGLNPNTEYTLTFSNITSEIAMIATNDKMKMIDESYIPCSRYITVANYNCTVTTTETGEIFIKVTNSGLASNYDIDITL